MSDAVVYNTLGPSIFVNSATNYHETISGSWTDSFNSEGVLIGASAVDITLYAGSPIVYTTGYVKMDGPSNYELVANSPFYAPAESGIDLFWATETPASLSANSVNIFYSSTYTLSGTAPITATILCFAGGTLIRTPEGQTPVEQLHEGDLVLTAAGEAKPVRWLGISEVAGRFAHQLHAAPILIKAGALGANLPLRDLRLSPAHAVYLDNILVQAGALVNGSSILREPMPEHFVWYHVELDTHELLLAEGLAAESFVDNVDRLMFSNAAERAGRENTPIREMPLPRARSWRQLPLPLRAYLAALTRQAA